MCSQYVLVAIFAYLGRLDVPTSRGHAPSWRSTAPFRKSEISTSRDAMRCCISAAQGGPCLTLVTLMRRLLQHGGRDFFSSTVQLRRGDVMGTATLQYETLAHSYLRGLGPYCASSLHRHSSITAGPDHWYRRMTMGIITAPKSIIRTGLLRA